MTNSTFPFTVGKLDALKASGKLRWFTDLKAPGLQLGLTATGTKVFYFRKRVNGNSIRKRLGKYPGMSIDKARKAVRELDRQVDHGETLRTSHDATFAKAFELWMNSFAKKAKKTWQEDQRKFDRDLKPLHNKQLKQLTRDDITKFHADMGAERPVHANRCLALIKTVINYAIDHESFAFDGKNPAAKVKKFPEQSRERFLSTDEMKRFFAAMSELDELYSDFFTVLLYTGVRRGNLAEMNWRHVDLDHAVWSIPRTKNGDGLTVPLAAPVVDILKRRKTTARNEWVFPSRHKPWTNMSDPRKAWDKLVAAAELHDVHMHDLRRTLGSWQAMNGVSELVVGRTLGHRPGSKATSVYARMNLDTVRTAVDVAVEKMAACAKEGANDE